MTVHVNIQEKCLFKKHTREMMYALITYIQQMSSWGISEPS